jgi:hypothetical protein
VSLDTPFYWLASLAAMGLITFFCGTIIKAGTNDRPLKAILEFKAETGIMATHDGKLVLA